jgi:hypothetical protein
MHKRVIRPLALALAIAVAGAVDLGAQARGNAQRGRGAAPPAPTVEPAIVECPAPLGEGVTTQRSFCDVMIGDDPAAGIIIKLPPHTGDLTLRFDLHNRHTYSEDLIKQGRGYRRYTATIGALTLNNDPLSLFVVQNEFRTAADLVDRVGGGAGPGGVKAVAPTGTESIVLTVPQAIDVVSLIGLRLTVVRPDATPPDNFTVAGRPVAVISNVTVEYRPAAARRPATRGR